MIIPGMVSITFRGLSAERVVEVTRAAGLSAIEWGGDIHVPPNDTKRAEAVGRATRDAGLRVISYGSYYRAGDPDERTPAFEPVLETALALGAPLVRVWAGRRGTDRADDAYRAHVVSDALRIAALAEDAGLRVSFEYHRSTLTDTPEAAERLLREAEHPNLCTHWQPPRGYSAEDAVRSLAAVLPRLGHVHVFHWGADAADRRALTEGEAVWRPFLAVAAQSPREHGALLEFVAGDSEKAFLRDADVLRRWVAEAAPGGVGTEGDA